MGVRVIVTIVLGFALSNICGGAPVRAAVEIDEKGSNQKKESHEAKHETHETKHVAAEHGHAKKTSNDGKESHAVEIDENGAIQKKAKHDTHETKHAAAEHGHAKKASNDGKESHENSHAQTSEKAVNGGVVRKEHHAHADKEQSTHASLSEQSVFSDEEEDDTALDELEAMTIARTLEKKHTPPWGPPAAVPCTWHEWENDGSCSYTCGGRGKTGQKMSRGKNPAKHGGVGCHGKTTKQVECAIEECPTTTTTTEEEATTTTAGGAPRMTDLSSLTLLTSLVLVVSMLG